MGNRQNHHKNEKGERLKTLITKAQQLITPKNQRILFAVTIIMAALSIWDVVEEVFPLPVSIAIYVCAAISFFTSCALWVRLIRIFVRIVLIPFTERNRIASVLIKDYKLRTVIMALPGVGITLIFAGYNAFLGISRLSAWYGSLAGYYILVFAMRLISVLYAKSIYIDKNELTKEQRELKVYKNCGIILSVMSLALMGAVTMLVVGAGGKTYPGTMVYVMAAYTFYKLINSIINMVKARREKSLLLITMRNVGHSEALVALLSLQTALFAAFGQDSGNLVPIMNAATGAAVCIAALVIGMHMVFDSKKRNRIYAETLKGEISNG